MNTPASSSTASRGSDATSSPGPDTPKSPVQLRRSRLSGSFGELIGSSSSTAGEAWMTPTRGTRKLIDELKRAKLDLDNLSSSSSGGDSDDEEGDGKDKEEDLENVFKVRKQSTILLTTPSRKRPQQDAEEEEKEDMSGEDMSDGDWKELTGSDKASQQRTPSRQRKRPFLDLDDSSPARRSPRSVQGRDKQERQGSSNSNNGILRTSPSPPASPTRRSTRTSLVFPSLPSPTDTTSKAPSSSLSSTMNSNLKGETKKPGQQATISSFFTTKAGTGTGILKARIGSANSNSNNQKSASSSNTTSTADTDTRDQQMATKRTGSGPSALQEPPKKLEQLFLAFSKDQTKSNTTANNTASSASSKQRPAATPTRRPNQLAREDEKLKRYHCPQCGMPYIRGQPEDEQIHDRYHRVALGGIDYPGYKNEVVVSRFRDLDGEANGGASGGRNGSGGGGGVKGESGLSSSSSAVWRDAEGSRIVMVSMSDSGRTAGSISAGGSSFEKKKVKEVLDVVNKELGSVEFDPEQLDSCRVFLYISGKKKVVGCLIAERIKEGFEIMTLGEESERSLAESRTSGVRSMNTSGGGAAIFCSKVPQPAICGINRVWVSSQHRRQRIASRMLDAVRERFIYACKLEPKDLAFSQPTGDGKELARQYLGTDRFLVYVE
ncbi:N-acetyltransferase esco2 [Mortierella sp. 14UC]|nr:N-acetyltransferase esco2 [Mortierella sp. 14UC]